MTSPLAWFGLPPDADERALKRAYAQRLRDTRPDDDPQGFQQLHAMYQQALAQCRSGAASEGRSEHGSVAPVVTALPAAAPVPAPTAATPPPVPLPRPPSPAEIDALAQAIIATASLEDAGRLLAYLRERPELWSLQVKQAVGWRCMERLFQQAPPMAADNFAALLGFFDLDRVRSGLDPASQAKLARRMQLAWELQAAHRAALERRLGASTYTPKTVQRLLAEAVQPYHWLPVLAAGLWPAAAKRRLAFLLALSQGHLNELPAEFNRRRMQFWWDAAQTHSVTRARVALGAARWLLAMLITLVLGALLSQASPNEAPLTALLVLTSAGGVLWAGWMLYLPLDRWHGQPEHQAVRWPWLNLLTVPLLCLLGALLKWSQPKDDYLYLLPLVPAAWLALRRLWRRSPTLGWLSPNVVRIGAFLIVPTLRVLTDTDITCAMLAVFALIPWALDLWRHRGTLRVMAGRA